MRVPSGAGVIKMSKKGMGPSHLVSSAVAFSIEFMCFKNLPLCWESSIGWAIQFTAELMSLVLSRLYWWLQPWQLVSSWWSSIRLVIRLGFSLQLDII